MFRIRTGKFALTSANAFPPTPPETEKSLYGLTVNARASIGAQMTVEVRERTMAKRELEKCMMKVDDLR